MFILQEGCVMKIEDIVNRTELRDRLDGDFELFMELADIFFKDSEKLLERISDAIKGGNPEQLKKAAHTLKGAVSNFSSIGAYKSAMALENMGKEGDFSRTDEEYQSLVKDIENLKTAMTAILEEKKI